MSDEALCGMLNAYEEAIYEHADSQRDGTNGSAELCNAVITARAELDRSLATLSDRAAEAERTIQQADALVAAMEACNPMIDGRTRDAYDRLRARLRPSGSGDTHPTETNDG